MTEKLYKALQPPFMFINNIIIGVTWPLHGATNDQVPWFHRITAEVSPHYSSLEAYKAA